MDTRPPLRLLDANANRAREGLRTAEDYARFQANHSLWAQRLKEMRASITATLGECFSAGELIAARNVSADPLRPEEVPAVPTALENSRTVALRGLKRAQEALRVLEEYLRASFPGASEKFSRHRYTAYEAEQWLMQSSSTANVLKLSQVYVLLTESLCQQPVLKVAEDVLRGGARVLQLREKSRNDQSAVALARDLASLGRSYQALTICNDRVDWAVAAGCDGVHLGQDDLTPGQARSVCGERLLIGRSTHSVAEARRAVDGERADYIAIGAMFPTSTKTDARVGGLGVAREIMREEFEVPVFAIGGITLENLPQLKAIGVKHIAVSSCITSCKDVQLITRRFVEAMRD